MPRERPDHDDYFARPLICPVCERWAEGDAWPNHVEFGYRFCPVCKAEDNFTVIPRPLTDDELTQWNESSTGW